MIRAYMNFCEPARIAGKVTKVHFWVLAVVLCWRQFARGGADMIGLSRRHCNVRRERTWLTCHRRCDRILKRLRKYSSSASSSAGCCPATLQAWVKCANYGELVASFRETSPRADSPRRRCARGLMVVGINQIGVRVAVGQRIRCSSLTRRRRREGAAALFPASYASSLIVGGSHALNGG